MSPCLRLNILCAALLLAAAAVPAAIGQSAIITLQFPFGARSTGLAESFASIADNADATYYNPAGLGQAPLANSWTYHTPVPAGDLSSVAASRRKTFGGRERIWIGSLSRGLLRFDGRIWQTYDSYVIEPADSLRTIVSRVLLTDDKALLDRAVRIVRAENRLGTVTEKFAANLIGPALADSLKNAPEAQNLTRDLSESIAALSTEDRTPVAVYGIIASKLSPGSADSIANRIAAFVPKGENILADLVELKIPFTIALQDTVSAICIDASDKLWAATPHGLWSYDGSVWKQYTTADGLPSNSIHALAANEKGTLACATSAGAAVYADGLFKAYTAANGLPSAIVHAVAVSPSGLVYAGTDAGLARIGTDSVSIIDTADGLISNSVTAVAVDNDGSLWVGGRGGVAVFNGTSWKRYKFPGSTVTGFAPYHAGKMWIATDKGAIHYEEGRLATNSRGEKVHVPNWRPYHSKNALHGNDVRGLAVSGKDVWIVTDQAVNQYDKGDINTTFFYEFILPSLKLPDLWHAAFAGVFPTEEWGTIGGYFNYLNFGKNVNYDPWGRQLKEYSAGEFVGAISYGLPLTPDFSFGLNVKYARSKLTEATGTGRDGIGRTFAIDAGILKRNLLIKDLDFGFVLMNMGPPVKYLSTDKASADPIPFIAKAGISFTPLQTPLHTIMLTVDADREIVKKVRDKEPYNFIEAIKYDLIADPDETAKDELKQIVLHFGIEYWYLNFIAIRTGYMYDKAGERREVPVGIGLRYGNMGVDWSYIYSPDKAPRDGQWRFSMLFNP